MDTKSMIIDITTTLFQQKGYMGVGLTEILKACNISKGSLYHHFPDGKEELLIACLQSLNDSIIQDTMRIFNEYPTTREAIKAAIDKLILDFETKGTLTGYTFSSIVNNKTSLSDPVRRACTNLYHRIQKIYFNKLLVDGFDEDKANSIAVMITASIEGGITLCITEESITPLKVISQFTTNLLKEF